MSTCAVHLILFTFSIHFSHFFFPYSLVLLSYDSLVCFYRSYMHSGLPYFFHAHSLHVFSHFSHGSHQLSCVIRPFSATPFYLRWEFIARVLLLIFTLLVYSRFCESVCGSRMVYGYGKQEWKNKNKRNAEENMEWQNSVQCKQIGVTWTELHGQKKTRCKFVHMHSNKLFKTVNLVFFAISKLYNYTQRRQKWGQFVLRMDEGRLSHLARKLKEDWWKGFLSYFETGRKEEM